MIGSVMPSRASHDVLPVECLSSPEKALAIYATGRVTQQPVRSKHALVEELRTTLTPLDNFCESIGVDLVAIELEAAIRAQLDRLIEMNETRVNFRDRFEALIEEYNRGSKRIEQLFQELLELSRSLTEEETRHVRERLTEAELAVFDLLTRRKCCLRAHVCLWEKVPTICDERRRPFAKSIRRVPPNRRYRAPE